MTTTSQLVSIRRATKIRNRVTKLMATVQRDIKDSVNVDVSIYFDNVHFDVNPKLDASSEKYNVLFARWTALNNLNCALRQAIGRANVECGISDLLAQKHANEETLGLLRSISVMAEPRSTGSEISGKAKSLQAALETGNSYQTAFTVRSSCLWQSDIDAIDANIDAYQKSIANIEDELETLNASTKILLSEDVVAALQSEGLLS